MDFANITGLGIGAVLLALVFRTLWRQEGGWRLVLNASREDAALAREDAAQARADAAHARADARLARGAEGECRRRLERLDLQVAELLASTSSTRARLDVIDSGEHPITPAPDPDL